MPCIAKSGFYQRWKSADVPFRRVVFVDSFWSPRLVRTTLAQSASLASRPGTSYQAPYQADMAASEVMCSRILPTGSVEHRIHCAIPRVRVGLTDRLAAILCARKEISREHHRERKRVWRDHYHWATFILMIYASLALFDHIK